MKHLNDIGLDRAQEFDWLFRTMLECAGFQDTSMEQRFTLLCCLRGIDPEFSTKLLENKFKIMEMAIPIRSALPRR